MNSVVKAVAFTKPFRNNHVMSATETIQKGKATQLMPA